MKNIKLALVLATAGLAVAACSSEAPEGVEGAGEAVITRVGNETVAVMPMEVSGRLYKPLPDYVTASSVVVEATITGVTPRLREVQPPATAEGVRPGEGADIYGAVDFAVTRVVKGTPSLKTLRVVYISGKRDGSDKTKRIAYLQDSLSGLQLPNGDLRPVNEFTGKTFVIFADSATPTDIDPTVHPNEYAVGPAGIATVKADGGLAFGKSGKAPVSADGNLANAPEVTLSKLRAAGKTAEAAS